MFSSPKCGRESGDKKEGKGSRRSARPTSSEFGVPATSSLLAFADVWPWNFEQFSLHKVQYRSYIHTYLCTRYLHPITVWAVGSPEPAMIYRTKGPIHGDDVLADLIGSNKLFDLDVVGQDRNPVSRKTQPMIVSGRTRRPSGVSAGEAGVRYSTMYYYYYYYYSLDYIRVCPVRMLHVLRTFRLLRPLHPCHPPAILRLSAPLQIQLPA